MQLATAIIRGVGERRLTGGEFYGNVLGKSTVGGAIFTELPQRNRRLKFAPAIPVNDVHRLRVREACERMLDPKFSLAEISMDLGFADQSHFSRTFRDITELRPWRFGRSWSARQLFRALLRASTRFCPVLAFIRRVLGPPVHLFIALELVGGAKPYRLVFDCRLGQILPVPAILRNAHISGAGAITL